MTVGSGEENVGGCVLLYRSKDLRQWEYLHKLTGGQWNGHKTPNPCDDGEMWECPELFPLPGSSICTHALIFSTMGRVIWQSGVLDPETMLFTMKKSGELDLGAFYAPKTQLDAHGRRILWGWIQERRSDAAMTAAGWSGMMSLPRVLALDPAGNLRIRIVPETAVLRGNSLPVAGISGGITCTLPAANGELLVTGSKDKDFKLRLGENGELATVEYSAAAHSMRIGGKEIALQPTDVPTIHGFIDGSVIELILAQRIGCTKRFYYQGAAPGVAAFVESSDPALKLAAWSVKPISPNRLTTPA
jgi:beta-fructofuranosidase